MHGSYSCYAGKEIGLIGKAPIYEALLTYGQQNYLRLHMPGHAGLPVFPSAELNCLGKLDLTEVPGLDDLHSPEGVIKEAQALLAEAFGAYVSYFLVNGATSGIQALFMSLMGKESIVLIPRNAHRSFFGAMVLSGVKPAYIPCQYNKEMEIALAVSHEDVTGTFREVTEVSGIFLVSPSYFGTNTDVSQIADLAGKHGIPLFVDEAHGGHFPFHPDYPVPALQCGAQAVVNGLHKTLPVLNQGACLHLSKSCPNPEQVVLARSILTTTSPSYPVLASIDLARLWMENHGRLALDRALNLSQEYRHKIDQIKGIQIYSQELFKQTAVKDIDPLKLLISVRDLDCDGGTIGRLLRQDYGIQVEWEAPRALLAMMSMFHEKQDWDRLYRALKDIAQRTGCRYDPVYSAPKIPNPIVAISPRDAVQGKTRAVDLRQSIHQVSGEMVIPYPPGIPCLLPGELITPEVYEYIIYIRQMKIHTQGPFDANLDKIKIIDL